MTNGALWALTATQAAAEVAGGAISAQELAQALLDRIATVDKDIRAFAHLDPAHALSQARELDERRRNGLAIGPLHGVPVAIADIFDTEDYPTECGSPLLVGRRPYRDAGVVSRLHIAGAVIVGKTATSEFGYGRPAPTRNPRDPNRTPGGSSSGSAAAVAAGMVPLALGSQTEGSVIRSAAFCGVFGAKPTHGLVSRAGMLTRSRVLDHVGAFARTLEDVALVLDVIAGYDAADPDTRAVAAPAFRQLVSQPPPLPPKVAFVRTPIWEKADASTQAAFDELVRRLGDGAKEVELPQAFAGGWQAHRAIMAADMAHNLGGIVDKGGDGSSAGLRALLDEGRRVTATGYLAAVANSRRLRVGLAEIFDYYDAILTPASLGMAPKGLNSTGEPAFCSLWTLLGLPALSLPVLQAEAGMPLGVQLIGSAGDDARLLRTANWLLKLLSGKAPTRRRSRAKT